MNTRRMLTVRTHPSGGAIRERLKSDPTLAPARRMIILIHGYNNTEADARKAYRRFSLNTALDLPRLGTDVCEFFWPGDTGYPGSFLFYAAQIPRAIQSAERLSEYLSDLAADAPLYVSFICHSLGSRVALEVIAQLLRRNAANVIVERICLMAAAVPVEMLPTGQLLNDAARHALASLVLWSRVDRALGLAFLAGQAIAGERSTAAVGKTGGPDLFWPHAVNFTAHGYGHSDYWPRVGSAATVSDFLQLTGLPRVMVARAVREEAANSGREMTVRHVESRRLTSE